MTRLRPTTLVLLVVLGAAAGLAAVSIRGVRSGGRLVLDYDVAVLPGNGFQVEARTSGLAGNHPVFRLLDGWGLLQDQGSYVGSLTAEDGDGRAIEVSRFSEGDETHWRLARTAKQVTLRYRVSSYPPFQSPESSFAEENRFVLVGYSLFLTPARIRRSDSVAVTVKVASPAGWARWASWPEVAGAYRPVDLHELWGGIVVGGGFASHHLGEDPVSVTVLTDSSAGRAGLTLANRLLRVLRELEALFGGPPRGDRLRVLALLRTLPDEPGMSVLEGASEEGAFLGLASRDRYARINSLLALAVHECTHFYLGGAIAASPEPPYQNSPDLVWFMEGMTEYLTYQMMAKAGVISPAELSRIEADKDRRYREVAGGKRVTLAEAARHMEDRGLYSLVYSRGYLVAKLLHGRMTEQCGPEALDRTLERLFHEQDFYRTGKTVSPRTVRAAFETECAGIGRFIDRFAAGDEALPAPDEEPAARASGPPAGQSEPAEAEMFGRFGVPSVRH